MHARLHDVGDDVVAAMNRYHTNEFRDIITSGGSLEAYTLKTNEISFAVRAAKAIVADFAGVDILFGSDEAPIICEVNSNAHIRNMYDATGIDVSDFMIEHILHTLNTQAGYK